MPNFANGLPHESTGFNPVCDDRSNITGIGKRSLYA